MTIAARTRVTKSGGQVIGIRTEEMIQQALQNACRIAQMCEDYRGLEILVLDVTQVTPLFDYFVIATGRSRRQLHAMVDSSDDVMESHSSGRRSTEGYDTTWICHDYGDVVLHVFSPSTREQYDLENLWADAPRVDWKAVLSE